MSQRGACEQARRIKCRQRRVRVVEDQRKLGAGKRHGIAARGLLKPGDDLLDVSNALRLESAIDQLGHDNLAEAFAFGRLWANADDPVPLQLRGVYITVDEPP